MTDEVQTEETEGSVSVTMKADKGYEATWNVFHGTPERIKQDMIGFYGFDRDAYAGKTPFEVSVEAERLLKGQASVAGTLGGRVISKPAETPPASRPATQPTPLQPAVIPDDPATVKKDPWLVEPTEEEIADGLGLGAGATEPTLSEQIAAVTTIDDLKLLWSQNQAAFADSALMAEYKARGKAIKAAAA